MNKKQAVTEELSVLVLKSGNCPTLSGKSTLTYKVGCTEDSEIMLRITGNTNPGYFNSEWVKYADVQDLLSQQDQGKEITSFALVPLYRGKSTNSPSFLFAVLKQEGLVQLSESKKRCYDRCSDATFLASIKKLIDGKPVAEHAPKAKSAKNNKDKVAAATPVTITEAAKPEPATQEPAASEPATETGDVPYNKPAKRGRPKKVEQVVDVVVPGADQAETA